MIIRIHNQRQNTKMGSQCSTSSIKQQFETIRQFNHPSLGSIKLIRGARTYNNSNGGHHAQPSTFALNRGLSHDRNIDRMKMVVVGEDGQDGGVRDGQIIAVKEFRFDTLANRDRYLKLVKEAGSYSKIPTLLKVFSFEVENNQSGSNTIQLKNYRCLNTYPVNLYFAYYPFTLQEQFLQKRSHFQIQTARRPCLPKNLKLNSYQEIDRLGAMDRKIINLYYQEIEILRFIDYIVGALYFLNHLQHSHQAVCPENVMIDDQGKYALLDSAVFQLRTNYEVAYYEIHGKDISQLDEQDRQALKYLAPQLLLPIRNKYMDHKQSSEKCEIFSLGLIALEMCLIDRNILDEDPKNPNEDFPILDRSSLKLKRNAISKALSIVQTRYSQQLVGLLASMLECEPHKRINFSNLIDLLSPILVKNLEDINRLYNSPSKASSLHPQKATVLGQPKALLTDSYHPLYQKLSELETNYSRIMAKASMLDHSISDCEQVGLEDHIANDEKRILNELKRISGKPRPRPKPDDKRQVKGSELYDLYLGEYEIIKRNRLR